MLALGVMICRQLHSGERFETLLDVMTAGRGGYTHTYGGCGGGRCIQGRAVS